MKTLILNFGAKTEFVANILIANNYANANTNEKITMLTFEDNYPYFKSASNKIQIRTIDKNFIKFVANSKLLSKQNAIDQFMSQCQDILDTEWEKTIDLDVDTFSVNFHSVLISKNKIGTTLDANNICQYDSTASLLCNEWTNSKNAKSLISQQYINASLLGLVSNWGANSKILDEDEAKIKENFNKLRRRIGETVKLVCIDLNGFQKHDYTLVCSIVNYCVNSFEYYPVLVYQAKNGTYDFLEKINRVFNNSLLGIRCSQENIPTLGNYFSVTISTEEEFNTLTSTSESVNILILNSLNDFSIKTFGHCLAIERRSETTLISDIENALNCYATNSSINAHLQNPYIEITNTNNGININSTYAITLKTIFSTLLLNKYIGRDKITFSKDASDQRNIKEDISHINAGLVQITKYVLGAIRLIKSQLNDNESVGQLINYLEQIYTHADVNNTYAPLVVIFKSHIERMDGKTPDENIKAIESALFNLKDNTRVFLNIIDDYQRIENKNSNKEVRI